LSHLKKLAKGEEKKFQVYITVRSRYFRVNFNLGCGSGRPEAGSGSGESS